METAGRDKSSRCKVQRDGSENKLVGLPILGAKVAGGNVGAGFKKILVGKMGRIERGS